jgi:prolyl 4-hydroxylase
MTIVSAPAAPATVPPTALPAQWQDWIANNIVQGCIDVDMVKVMVENGFEPVFSAHAISVVRAMTERVRQQVPGMLTDYQADAIRLPASGRVRAADREVQIGFVLRNPNVALIENLLSEDECAKMIQLSAGKLRRSEVVATEQAGYEVSQVRTSDGTHFQRGENALVTRIEARLAALCGVPIEHGEPLQILHYQPGGRYLPHHDYFESDQVGGQASLQQGGQRIITVVTYLNDVPEGGDTTFPELELAIKPRRGCAVYFEYHNHAGQVDPRCLHAGEPVIRGEKWIATKWIRKHPYHG